MSNAVGSGTHDDPWTLKTPSGSSAYQMYRDETADPPALVCVVGKTTLAYRLSCIDDLHAMLKEHGDWMALGSADEQKPAAPGTVEAWGRADRQPGGRLVRPEEGPARPLRHVRAAAARSPRPGRGRAQSPQQPHACAVGAPSPTSAAAGPAIEVIPVCRNIKTLYNFEPPATHEEVHAAALQFVRKISGFTAPSAANEAAFERAVADVERASTVLLGALVTAAPHRDREIEAARAHARAVRRYGS